MEKNKIAIADTLQHLVLHLLPIIILLFGSPCVLWAQAEPTLDAMLGAMIMCGFRDAELTSQSPILQRIAAGRLGHVILFDRDVTTKGPRNIRNKAQLQRLTSALHAAARRPMLIAVDQEGGLVRRLKPEQGFLPLEDAKTMGSRSPQYTAQQAKATARELRELGINADLAPVADVETTTNNQTSLLGRQLRCFSKDAHTVAAHVIAFGQGLLAEGILPTLKHFPGLGCAGKDTHHMQVAVDACYKPERDLLPFKQAIDAGWPGLVMVSHAIVPALSDDTLPATLSPAVVTGVLRGQLGFQGVVVSDDLDMGAITTRFDRKKTIELAVLAGCDILLFGNNLTWDPDLPDIVFASLKELVASGRISKARIKESWLRIQHLWATLR
ncbi:MAG: glycoside hydrolase family 3 protein [Desulfovibrio sp.]|nr:glycoside hydrolase family 3 protein [Desulfovibrio sp.]